MLETRNDMLPNQNSNFVTLEEASKKPFEFIEQVTINADEIQSKVLAEILSRNAHVEYLQRHSLDSRTDRETFKKLIPVGSYEDLAPYIQRIANGDKSPILCSDPISEILRSTATSGGESKLIPFTDEELTRRLYLHRFTMSIIGQFIGGLEQGKGVSFTFAKSESQTPGGLPLRLATTSYLKKIASIITSMPHIDLLRSEFSPIETMLCTDNFLSMYTRVLCSLAQRDIVVWVGSAFALGLICVIKFIEKHWGSLVNDLRTGTPNPTIVTDLNVRKGVIQILAGPNPQLADFVETECRKESWKGIINRLWPNTKYINTIVTGTMAQYVSALDYYSDGIPVVSNSYGASEGYFGINLNPLCKPCEVIYTLFPHMAYFEFELVKETDDGNVSLQLDEARKLVDLVDVQLGKEYELVVTTYTGLYRYRVGDVLRVAGFKNNAPQFTFVRRANVILSIHLDKTNEVELYDAVNIAANHLRSLTNYSLVEYTSYADTSKIPGHYVLFWEIVDGHCYSDTYDSLSGADQASVLEECCLMIEELLNSSYREWRVQNSFIGPLEIRVVKGGTFDEMMDIAIRSGASISQYKVPKCVKNPRMLELLNSRILSKHFSPKCPKWAPARHNDD